MTFETEKPKLIYVGDPMCSWCYGISEELNKVVEFYGEKFDIELVMGGLRAGGGEEWNETFISFLRHHWEDVGMKSGQPFSFKLLDEANFDYDTEPACRAVVTAGEMNSDKKLSFFKATQKGFYTRSEDPKKVAFYKSICDDLGLDYTQFVSNFSSNEMKQKTIKNFERSAQLGARSFPTVLLEHNGEIHRIAIGYSTFEKMQERIDQVILK
jgi:putative protein-disulfide isomerase